jgi:hypothetical protein
MNHPESNLFDSKFSADGVHAVIHQLEAAGGHNALDDAIGEIYHGTRLGVEAVKPIHGSHRRRNPGVDRSYARGALMNNASF